MSSLFFDIGEVFMTVLLVLFWDLGFLPRLISNNIKIIHMRTFGLSIQNKGPATVKLGNFHGYSMVMENSQFYSCRFIISY